MDWAHVERQRARNWAERSRGDAAVASIVKSDRSRFGYELYRLIGGSEALQLISRSK